MMVLDASAVLAMLNGEPGAERVAESLSGAVMSAVNLAEVLGKVIDVGGDIAEVRSGLSAAGVRFAAMEPSDAALVAALRQVNGGKSLSLGDRTCLALALRLQTASVLTADRVWFNLDLPIEVELVR